MAIIGIQIDRNNPPFTIDDFTFWMPQYARDVKVKEWLE